MQGQDKKNVTALGGAVNKSNKSSRSKKKTKRNETEPRGIFILRCCYMGLLLSPTIHALSPSIMHAAVAALNSRRDFQRVVIDANQTESAIARIIVNRLKLNAGTDIRRERWVFGENTFFTEINPNRTSIENREAINRTLELEACGMYNPDPADPELALLLEFSRRYILFNSTDKNITNEYIDLAKGEERTGQASRDTCRDNLDFMRRKAERISALLHMDKQDMRNSRIRYRINAFTRVNNEIDVVERGERRCDGGRSRRVLYPNPNSNRIVHMILNPETNLMETHDGKNTYIYPTSNLVYLDEYVDDQDNNCTTVKYIAFSRGYDPDCRMEADGNFCINEVVLENPSSIFQKFYNCNGKKTKKPIEPIEQEDELIKIYVRMVTGSAADSIRKLYEKGSDSDVHLTSNMLAQIAQYCDFVMRGKARKGLQKGLQAVKILQEEEQKQVGNTRRGNRKEGGKSLELSQEDQEQLDNDNTYNSEKHNTQLSKVKRSKEKKGITVTRHGNRYVVQLSNQMENNMTQNHGLRQKRAIDRKQQKQRFN